MNPRQELEQVVDRAVKAAFGVELTTEVLPAEAGRGDFATNAAFKLAGELKRSPLEIAEELAAQLKHADITSARAAAPGFINITLSAAYWRRYLEQIDEKFSQSRIGQGQKVQVEFISANPTGPLTLGNARGGFIGDLLSNVLDSQGFEVTREYYFNDSGTQISKLLESVKIEAGLATGEERQYSGEYIAKLATEFKVELQNQDDATLKNMLTTAIIERYIKPDIAKMGINFDVWFNERELIDSGALQDAIKQLRLRGLVFERDGATWLNTAQAGDARGERVIIKSNGDPTYLAPDITYHANIFGQRGFDIAIKEFGPDHIAQFPSLKAAVASLFPDKQLRLVAHQQLRLIRGGREYKMSKRLGQYVTVGELIDQVGGDVARWFMLMRSSDTHMDFDLDLAAEQSQKNPFWYVMYAYVRATAIRTEAAKRGLASGGQPGELSPLECRIVRKLAELPVLLEQIAADYQVHRLTFYGSELAALFHDWYEQVRVVELAPAEAAAKLYFLGKFLTALSAYWQLMGIKPRRRM